MPTPEQEIKQWLSMADQVTAVLSQRRKNTQSADKVTVRPFVKKGEPFHQFVYQQGAKVRHENLPSHMAADLIWNLLDKQYHQGLLTRPGEELHITHFAKWKCKRAAKESETAQPQATHDRVKNHIIAEGRPVAFLTALGVMDETGRVYKDKQAKFRQINQFLALLAEGLKQLPKDRVLRVVDFGCGKSYLTFALHHYMTAILGSETDIVGIDLKADVVARCQALAETLRCRGLSFRQGEIGRFQIDGAVDAVVCLHACDTATDDAIRQGIGGQAGLIYCAPCCQHEFLSSIGRDDMKPLLRHGVVKERIAALLTDALRADFLAACGYKTTVCEFIETEHTPKNLLLKAAIAHRPDRAAFERVAAYARSWGVAPYLEKELRRLLGW